MMVPHSYRGALCPACGLRMCIRIYSDAAECPEHGLLSGLFLLQIAGMEPWEAEIEIAAYQIQEYVRHAFERANTWLYNDSKLKIRVPQW